MIRFVKTFIDQIPVIDFPLKYIVVSTLLCLVAFIVAYIIFGKTRKWINIAIGVIASINFAVFYALNYTKGYVEFGLKRYWPFLPASVLLIAAGVILLFVKKKKGLIIIPTGIMSFAFIMWSLVYSIGLVSVYHFDNSTHMNYEDSMAAAIDDLEQNYILRGYKEIDFDALRDKYIPLAKEAQDAGDEVAFAEAVTELCYEFHDGHVTSSLMDNMTIYNMDSEILGNDYGFSMIRRDDGNIVAIWVDEYSEAYSNGIYNGTVITKWDGIDIDDALLNVRSVNSRYNFPLKENEDIVKPIFLAGKGGDTLSVSFLDMFGYEKTVELSATEMPYCFRFQEVMNAFLETKTSWAEMEYMVDNHTGCLPVYQEFYDDWKDMLASFSDEYPDAKDYYIDKIENLRNMGMDRLIIDLRDNRGGYIFIGAQLVSLFSDKESTIYTGTYSDTNGFKMNKGSGYTVQVDGRYADIPVVVLVNSECVSCGDQVAAYLSECPNVTIMGTTTTQGSGQWNGGVCLLSGGTVAINYPVVPSLDENGDVFVDAGPERETFLELDERIPIDDRAISEFNNYVDYEIQYAAEYLNRVN